MSSLHPTMTTEEEATWIADRQAGLPICDTTSRAVWAAVDTFEWRDTLQIAAAAGKTVTETRRALTLLGDYVEWTVANGEAARHWRRKAVSQ